MVTRVQASQQIAGAVVLLSCHGEFSGGERDAVVSSSLQSPQFVVFYVQHKRLFVSVAAFPPLLGEFWRVQIASDLRQHRCLMRQFKGQ